VIFWFVRVVLSIYESLTYKQDYKYFRGRSILSRPFFLRYV
jgi:hypothetical protein